ncbi:hypothetical protein V490_07649 [Pseudogymnoascus sp. VKM F-3557]|nr:hypothetical protein V490_07649 [Pseudogymnoascus sp. VKM F-3557]
MNFDIPPDLKEFLSALDSFIEREITPLQAQDDNERFFDHRREHSRTDWDNGGLPRPEWEALLTEARRRADKAGFYRLSLPVEYGGQNKGNLWMSVIREHLASKGLGLFNDLQNEHSVVGNFPTIVMLLSFGNEAQRKEFIPGQLAGKVIMTFGLTEPDHGSDATHLETVAKPQTRNGVEGFVINGQKKWQTGMHVATHCILFARTSGRAGSTTGITAFIVPARTPGIKVESYEWTFNMPTDHATVSLNDVWVPSTAIFGPPTSGLSVAQAFLHDNRIRQAASSLGAATFCIRESIKYAKERKPFGKALAWNQGIQFPLVELLTQTEMLRLLIRKTANDMDSMPHREVEKKLTDKVSMCNYWANRLCCESADRAIQVHGGIGYSRHKPFEHIYRHHRRYRITEGSEEVQMRKVAFKVFELSDLAKAQKKPAKLLRFKLIQAFKPDVKFGSAIQMKFSYALPLAFLTSAATQGVGTGTTGTIDGDVAAIPLCAQECIGDATLSAGCPTPNDYQCQCGSARSKIEDKAASCIISKCTITDGGQSIYELTDEICQLIASYAANGQISTIGDASHTSDNSSPQSTSDETSPKTTDDRAPTTTRDRPDNSDTTSSSTHPASNSKPVPVGAIVGGVVGGLAVIALFAFAVIVFIIRSRRNRQSNPGPSPHQSPQDEYIKPELNPQNPPQPYFPPPSFSQGEPALHPQPNQQAFQQQQPLNPELDSHTPAPAYHQQSFIPGQQPPQELGQQTLQQQQPPSPELDSHTPTQAYPQHASIPIQQPPQELGQQNFQQQQPYQTELDSRTTNPIYSQHPWIPGQVPPQLRDGATVYEAP